MIRLAACLLMLSLATPAALGEPVPSPLYRSWAKHQPGTSVNRMIENRVGMEMLRIDITQTLVEVTQDKAVVEVETRISVRNDTLAPQKQRVNVPANVEKYSDLLPVDFNAVVTEERTETVEILGRTLTCRVLDFEGESKPRDNKPPSRTHGAIWVSEEVPGAIVQILRTVEMTAPDGSKVEGTSNTAIARIDVK